MTHARATRWLDPDEQRTWRAFLTAVRLLEDRLESQLQRDAGVPHAYYEVLVRLSEAPGRALRMSELAAAVGHSRSRLSHAVSRLEGRGWVGRSACPGDGRGQVAALTDGGLEALRGLAPGHVEAVRSALFDALSATQTTALRQASEALVAHLAPAGSAS